LARRVIELSGKTIKDENNPDGDIVIEITGLRPGEKLFEELLLGGNPELTAHPRIMKAQESFLVWSDLEPKLNELSSALRVDDVGTIRSMIKQLVPEYSANNDIVDWVFMEQTAGSNHHNLVDDLPTKRLAT
jgi:FlaA1/EpsC-like NDP-sugar epimerase